MTTCRDIVTRSLRELRAIAAGESPSADEASDALAAFNGMIAAWRTQSIVISYPAGLNWRGEWATNTTYAANDGVSYSGLVLTCSTGHTSSYSDTPMASPNWSTYWTIQPFTALALSDAFPLPAQFEEGVTAMLAVRIAPQYGTDPSQLTLRKASDGENALLAAYMTIRPASADNGIIRMPSQIWPYSVDQVN